MNPFLAAEYGTEANSERLRRLARSSVKVAGLVDAFLANKGYLPGGKHGQGVLYNILFPMLSQATLWPLRSSTSNIPQYLNTFRRLEAGPGVFGQASQQLQSLVSGGQVQPFSLPGIGPVGQGWTPGA